MKIFDHIPDAGFGSIRKVSLVAVLLLVLANCSATTDVRRGYDPAGSGPLAPDRARMVLYNTPVYLAHAEADMHFAGVDFCSLPENTYTVKDIVPGKTTSIEATLCGRLAISRLTIRTVAGKTYYLRVRPNDDSALGILSRLHTPAPVQKFDPAGPFAIEHMRETDALDDMKAMTPSHVCH